MATAATPKQKAKKPTKAPSKKIPPKLTIEKALWAAGHDVVVGIDEVGRGSWAGPLAIGAAVLPTNGGRPRARHPRFQDADRASA